MSQNSSIEWTDATWNPVRGCALVSPGCTNCYAMRQAHRTSGKGGYYEGLTRMTKGGPVWTGTVREIHDAIEKPLYWKRPRRIFVNSMSDLFHEGVTLDFIAEVFAIMAMTPQHTYQLLTKRPARMLAIMNAAAFGTRIIEALMRHKAYTERTWPLPNVWLGVSVEDQARAEERIPLLLRTPAAVRWISAEPLLGKLIIDDLHELDWVVAGGESGPGARPMHPAWVRWLRDECAAAHVPFFFKQWGTWSHECNGIGKTVGRAAYFPDLKATFSRWSKRNTGRELDGRTHDEYPA